MANPAWRWVANGFACVTLAYAAAANADDDLSFLPDTGDANLTFYLDNDLFASEDENYTNGVRLSWISGARDPEDFGWLQRQLQDLTGDEQSRKLFRRLSGFEDPDNLEYNYGFSITQLMFTPEDLDAPSAPPGERPYAAWLGIDLSLHAKDANALNSVSVAIGTTGKPALGEEAQDLVHGIRGLKKFQGWDSQIPAELTINFFMKQRRRVSLVAPQNEKRFSIDGFMEWRLAAGNYLTGASLGGLLRFGWNLPPSFADPRLAVTAYSHQPFRTQRKVSGWSFYGLTGALVTGVAHDITLDGPVFRGFDSPVSSKAVVGEIYAGFGVDVGNWNFSYVHTFRSKEFKGQDEAASFGSLTIGYRI